MLAVAKRMREKAMEERKEELKRGRRRYRGGSLWKS